MSFFKPKFVLLALLCALVSAGLASGCSGGAFESSGASAGTGTSGTGASSSGGTSSSGAGNGEAGDVGTAATGATNGKACGGPEDCDDGDTCTTDRCNADGTCQASAKCTGNQQCCDGDCAECCDDGDCNDGVECTDNTCFSGQCMYVPNDTMCEKTEYCSTKDDCRPKQACGIVAGEDKDICGDDSPCTADSCVGNFCQHDFCLEPGANLCCEGVGCAACCNDEQCDNDDDPCTVGSCQEGKCSQVTLCGMGQDCCPSLDRKTATCGACCSATDCDDKIGCTDDKCGGGQCSNTPNNSHCDAGYLCSPDPNVNGCVKAPDCSASKPCQPTACQTNPRCDNGTCHFDTCATQNLKCCAGVAGGSAAGCGVCCGDAECGDNVPCTKDSCGPNGCVHTPDSSLCAPGQMCTPGGCVACLQDADCDDKVACTKDSCSAGKCLNAPNCAAGYCDPVLNQCVQCTTDGDCQGGVITAAIPIPPGGGTCTTQGCVKGTCQDVITECIGEQHCCPPFGCAIVCGIQVN